MDWMCWAEQSGRSIKLEMEKVRNESGEQGYALRHRVTVTTTVGKAGDVHVSETGATFEEAGKKAIEKLRKRLFAAVE